MSAKRAYLAYTDGGFKDNDCGFGVYILELDLENPVKDVKDGLTLGGYSRDQMQPGKKNREEIRMPKAFRAYNKRYPILSGTSIYGGISNGTNNVGELTAAETALKELKAHADEGCPVIILSDSQYVLKAMSDWVFKWEANQWMTSTFSPVANLSLVQSIHRLQGKGDKFGLIWVRGHVGEEGNEKADELATRGLANSQDNDFEVKRRTIEMKKKEAEDAEIKKKTPKYNRIFSQTPSVYFMAGIETKRTADGRYIYHMGNHADKDSRIRIDTAEATIASIFTKTPEPAIELCVEQYVKTKPSFPKLAVGKYQTMRGPKVYPMLTVGDVESNLYKEYDRDTFHLFTVRDDELVVIEHAPRVSYKYLARLHRLTEIGGELIAGKGVSQNPEIHFIDITDQFYVEGKKGMEMVPDFTSALAIKKLKVDLRFDTGLEISSGVKTDNGLALVPASVGKDIPALNLFKALSGTNAKVYFYTSERHRGMTAGAQHRAVDYGVVIVPDGLDGDLIVWGTPMRSVLFLNYR